MSDLVWFMLEFNNLSQFQVQGTDVSALCENRKEEKNTICVGLAQCHCPPQQYSVSFKCVQSNITVTCVYDTWLHQVCVCVYIQGVPKITINYFLFQTTIYLVIFTTVPSRQWVFRCTFFSVTSSLACVDCGYGPLLQLFLKLEHI